MITAGLLAPDPGQLPGGDWVFSPAALRRFTTRPPLLRSEKRARCLEAFPSGYCRPRMAELHRGDHDTAAFQAFKEVEVAVRTAGGFGAQKISTDPMRAAFEPDSVPHR